MRDLSLIKAAISRLPLKPSVDPEESAKRLGFLCGFAAVNGLVRMQHSRGATQPGKELQRFSRLASELANFLDFGMHIESLNVLESAGVCHPQRLSDDLFKLVRAADAARAAGVEAKGKPTKNRLVPAQVAQLCAIEFRNLTGKEPKRHFDPVEGKASGDFIQFVSDIFKALELDANAEHFARQAQSTAGPIGGGGGMTIEHKEECPSS